MLILKGKMSIENRRWIIEIPVCGAMTEGDSWEDAILMLKDYIQADLDKPIDFIVGDVKDGAFDIKFFTWEVIPWLLKRLREMENISLIEAARKMDLKSKNSYRRYETGDSEPGIGKLIDLLEMTDTNIIID